MPFESDAAGILNGNNYTERYKTVDIYPKWKKALIFGGIILVGTIFMAAFITSVSSTHKKSEPLPR